ncbi:Ubiquitin-conjugating enzyme E2 S [Blattella germanica]|nr:Ubiquitin-conjugating enzyme E2 S [Blattella germanica]
MSNVENLSPQIIRRVVKEMNDLVNEPPEGIKVNINDEDITDIQAYIEGPAGTPYAGGIFRVKLALGKDFPQTPPKAFFLTKIFHPNVAKNGEICVNTLKKDWKPDLGIKHILLTVKCLLIVPNAESALNEEAGKLLLEQYECYSQRAKMMTEIHALVRIWYQSFDDSLRMLTNNNTFVLAIYFPLGDHLSCISRDVPYLNFFFIYFFFFYFFI